MYILLETVVNYKVLLQKTWVYLKIQIYIFKHVKYILSKATH